jgi:hypothetical protein
MKPQDSDVVRLRRPIPEYDLPPGSKGTVANDIQTRGLPSAYLVEFAASDGVTQALITVAEDNLEIVWRPE